MFIRFFVWLYSSNDNLVLGEPLKFAQEGVFQGREKYTLKKAELGDLDLL